MSKDGSKAVFVSGVVDEKEASKPVPGATTHVNKGYQSGEALSRATAKPNDEEDGEPILAEVSDSRPVETIPHLGEELTKLVKVRSRSYIPPFRYGKTTYELPANKERLLPLYVKMHLEEKGLL